MAPLRNAVRLVDGKKRDSGIAYEIGEAVGDGPLRRHIEKVERAVVDLAPDRNRLLARQRRIQRSRIDAKLFQRLHLIAHQRDQRRDDDTQSGPAERRDLEAERLAGAGRKENDGIAASGHMLDHCLLLAAKGRIAIDAFQHVERCLAGFVEELAGSAS